MTGERKNSTLKALTSWGMSAALHKKKTKKKSTPLPQTLGSNEKLIHPDTIKGVDDAGNFYGSHADLITFQGIHREEFYDRNAKYWADGGCGGKTDNEAMVGDGGGIEDGEEGLAFLDMLIARMPALPRGHAIDLGAGVGRVTKLVLLKRYDEVRLVEADEGWSKRSRVYLGRKRASRCTFMHERLDDITTGDVRDWGFADLVWIQWTLQYLTDVDAVECLRTLAGGLGPNGVLVVKENRPYGKAREDRFQMEIPDMSVNQRYDITRPDAHHRRLFQMAGLIVNCVEKGEETNTYALMNQ